MSNTIVSFIGLLKFEISKVVSMNRALEQDFNKFAFLDKIDPLCNIHTYSLGIINQITSCSV